MIGPQDLAAALARNVKTVQAQTGGLTHADALLQPPFRGNCMNWVLGHVLENRNLTLQKLGQAPILSEAQAKRYGYGSEPVCDDGGDQIADILNLEAMLALLVQSQETIEGALGSVTSDVLAQDTSSFLGTTTLGQFLFFLYYHETYHVGQLELLRQLAGTDDAM